MLLIRLWKIVRAPFVAIWLFWLINRNQLITTTRDKMPGRQGVVNLVVLAFSFDTKTNEGSINMSLAQKVLEVLNGSNAVKTLFLQEEVYKALFNLPEIAEIDDWKGKEIVVIRYGDKDYLNSYGVVLEAIRQLPQGIRTEMVVVSHNHMFHRVKATIENLGVKVCGWMTAIGYDPRAEQPWVRSHKAFALREALAYVWFVLKGYI